MQVDGVSLSFSIYTLHTIFTSFSVFSSHRTCSSDTEWISTKLAVPVIGRRCVFRGGWESSELCMLARREEAKNAQFSGIRTCYNAVPRWSSWLGSQYLPSGSVNAIRSKTRSDVHYIECHTPLYTLYTLYRSEQVAVGCNT